MEGKTICKYSYSDTGIVLTTESLVVRFEDSERSVPVSKINSFYVYPKRGFLSKRFLVFANISGEDDFEVLSVEDKESAVGLKDDLNRSLDDV